MGEANFLRCPFCGKEYAEPFQVCTQCGMDRTTGRMHSSQIDELDPLEKTPRWKRAAAWAAEYLPGLFRPTVLIAAILMGGLGLAVTVFGIVLAFGLMAMLEGFITMVLGSLMYAQGVGWVLWGECRFLPDMLTDFDGMRWALFFTLLMTPGTITVIVVKMIVTGG